MAKKVPLDKFSKELRKYAEDDIEKYKKSVTGALIKNFQDIVKNSPVDTGLYAQSWDLILTEKNALLGNYAPHAGIIEFGARPFRPPLKPLLEWAKRVLKVGNYTSEVWALARYTQSKIEEHGMEPKHVLTNQLDKIVNDIRINLRKNFR